VTRSVLPGSWYAVLGPDLVLALPPGSRELAARAWVAVDSGAGADAVLDLVLSEGLSGLEGFALLSSDEGRTRAVARGHAVCLLLADGHEAVADGRTATTWAEVAADDVTAWSLEVGPPAEGEPLVVADGLVRVSRVLWPAEQAPAAQSVEPAGHVAEPAEPAEPAQAALEPPAPPDLEAPPAPVAAVVSAVETEAEPEPEAEPEAESEPVPDVEADAATEAFQPAPPPPPIWEPVQDDHDGRTLDGSWGTDLVAERHGIPGQPPAPPVTAHPVAALLLSTGDRIDVDRVVILGRAPEARRFSSTEQPRLVTVPSPQQEISSTHVEIRPGTGADHGTAVVTDLGSTNGTVLVQPGLPPESLVPGIPVQLLPGAVVDLGDGLTITVARP
jgi:hypothetical protein